MGYVGYRPGAEIQDARPYGGFLLLLSFNSLNRELTASSQAYIQKAGRFKLHRYSTYGRYSQLDSTMKVEIRP